MAKHVQFSLPTHQSARPARTPPGLLGVAAAAKFAGRGASIRRRNSKYTELQEDDYTAESAPKSALAHLRSRKTLALVEEEHAHAELMKEQHRRALIYCEDDKWMDCDTSVWFPCSPGKRAWDTIILLVLMYSIVMEPMRIGVDMQAEGTFYWVEMVFSLVFAVDIGLTFNTAYLETALEGDNWVIDRGKIARNYVQNRFFLELFSAYPAELIDLLAQASLRQTETRTTTLRVLRLLRLLRLFRVLRELQAIYADVLMRLESRFAANLAGFHLVGPLIILVYLMHLLACAFVAVGNYALTVGYRTSWMTEYEGGVAIEGTLRTRYLVALYWASGTSTGLGTGVIPCNEIEWFFVTCGHVVGVVVMGTIIGWIARSIEASQSPIEKMIEGRTDVIKDITRWRAMPPDLADRVIRFYASYARKHAAVLEDEAHLISALELNAALRREVLKHLLGKSVTLIPLFNRKVVRYATDDFQLAVDPLLKPVVHETNEPIFEQHTHGSTLYFLIDGSIKACTSIGGQDKHMLYWIREEGDLYGEHAILERHSDVSCVAMSRCDSFRLDVLDLLSLMSQFPHARPELGQYVLQHYVLKHKCQRYFSLRISLNKGDKGDLGTKIAGDRRLDAVLRIQLACFRNQNARLRYKRPHELAVMRQAIDDNSIALGVLVRAISPGNGGNGNGSPGNATSPFGPAFDA